LYRDQAIGVVSIGSANAAQKSQLLQNLEQNITFLETIAEFISAKVHENILHEEQISMLTLLQNLINLIPEGVIVMDDVRQIQYINRNAELILDATLGQIKYLSKIGRFSLSRVLSSGQKETEYFIRLEDRKISLIGSTHTIPGQENLNVFIFRDVITENSAAFTSSSRMSFNAIIGENNQFCAAKEQARVLAQQNAHVLLLGAAGTEKSQFAHAIHDESPRQDGLFLRLTCGEQLYSMEDALRGILSEASQEESIYALLDGATIYLRDIEKLSREAQDELVGLLQSPDCGFRVVAASTAEPEHIFNSSRLYHMLAPFFVQIPPLRDRREDITLLIEHYLLRFNRVLTKKISLDKKLVEAMVNYSWPENTYELQRTIGLIVSIPVSTAEITLDDLPEDVAFRLTHDREERFNLAQLEKRTILRALNTFSNMPNAKPRIAEALGISKATLYRKLQQYEITEKTSYHLPEDQ
jgi:transcriptional regulator with PAS, ATPase and Fis domain